MNISRLAIAMACILASAACGDSDVTAPAVPNAFIRFVHAMPDTLGVDFRAVDVVENSPYIATTFRDIKQAGYSPVAAGTRHFREFLSNPNAPIASTVTQVLVDTTLILAAGARYSIIHAGFARVSQSPTAQFVVMRDELPVPPTGQIAIRVVNLAAGMGNVDVYVTDTPTGALPSTPLFANATWLAPTSYVSVPVSATLVFRVTLAGAGNLAAPFATVVAPTGDVGTPSLDPIPGSAIAGSVFTVFVFARSTAGSAAPQTAAFQAPAMIVVPDVQLHNRPSS